MKDKAITIAYVTLFVGIGLLAFTFIIANVYLANNPSITASSDLVDTFGDALAPLIEAAIRIMYLGVMGWIGLGLTTRGVQLLTRLRHQAKTEIQSTTPQYVKPMEPIRTKKSKK